MRDFDGKKIDADLRASAVKSGRGSWVSIICESWPNLVERVGAFTEADGWRMTLLMSYEVSGHLRFQANFHYYGEARP